MLVGVTGASGLLGSALVPALRAAGVEVRRFVRREAREGEIAWDPSSGNIDGAAVDALDAIVHLAGENVGGRFTEAKKARIRRSRVEGTRLVAEALARARPKARTLISASAVGIYGDRGAECLDESASPGHGFLASVCREWEAATEPAATAGVRVVTARFGVVLAPQGGALQRMLRPFALGLGGRIGTGDQYMSWVAIDDAVGAVVHALSSDALAGPVHVTAPEPVSNAELTRVLGRVLRRPTPFAVPRVALEIALGSEFVREALFASTRALPTRLVSTGYSFLFPALEPALRHMLGR